MASYASEFSTIPGQLLNSGLSGLVELGNKYSTNETIGGLVAGTLADTYRTQINTGNALAYNDAFLSSLGKYQQGLETLKKGNSMELMAAEGQIAKDLQADQLRSSDYQSQLQTDAAKYGYSQQADATRYTAGANLEGTREQAAAQRYGYEQQAGATKYTADQGLKGIQEQSAAQRYGYEQQAGATKYVADQNLSGTKYGYDSQERQIGLTGEEQRKSLREQTGQQLALRRDARGAIARASARFFG